eukprot:4117507-Amphidinium_carterae.1
MRLDYNHGSGKQLSWVGVLFASGTLSAACRELHVRRARGAPCARCRLAHWDTFPRKTMMQPNPSRPGKKK